VVDAETRIPKQRLLEITAMFPNVDNDWINKVRVHPYAAVFLKYYYAGREDGFSVNE
jgi:hypothetical protein